MNLASIDLNLLTAFDALMEYRNVTRAGESMGLSQPAMSNALSRLRGLFGDQLLVRTSDGMTPTPRAMELHQPIRQALHQLQETIAEGGAFVPAEARRTFTVAMAEDASFLLLPGLNARMAAEAPGINIHVLSTAYVPGVELVDSGEAELSVAVIPPGTPGHIHCIPLFEQHLVAVARRGHPAFRDRLSRDDYLSYPHIAVQPSARAGSIVGRAISAAGHKRRVAVNLPHMMSVPFMLEDSDLIATLPERVARYFAPIADLVFAEAPVEMPRYQAYLAWHRRNEDDPGHRWMRSVIVEQSAGI